MNKKEFIDEFMDRIYMIGSKDDGKYTLNLKQAEQAASELYNIIFKRNNCEVVTIYKFQLETISEALRITSNIHKSKQGKTCHDRQVRQAHEFADNALAGNMDKEVPYMKGL